jgi:hypothetical protein
VDFVHYFHFNKVAASISHCLTSTTVTAAQSIPATWIALFFCAPWCAVAVQLLSTTSHLRSEPSAKLPSQHQVHLGCQALASLRSLASCPRQDFPGPPPCFFGHCISCTWVPFPSASSPNPNPPLLLSLLVLPAAHPLSVSHSPECLRRSRCMWQRRCMRLCSGCNYRWRAPFPAISCKY